MTEFKPGDIVDIAIKGARVRDVVVRNGGADLTFDYDHTPEKTWPGSIWANATAVTVERVAPSEWPPRPGDLWRDKHGVLWFTSHTGAHGDELRMQAATGGRWSVGHDGQLADNGPWVLVYREGSVVVS